MVAAAFRLRYSRRLKPAPTTQKLMGQSIMPEEKRRFARLNALVDVFYSKKDESKNQQLSLTKNISKGGICLITYEELKESQVLDLRIYLPQDKISVSAAGKVVWVKEFIIGDAASGRRFDVGVEFIEVSSEDREKIEKYVFMHI